VGDKEIVSKEIIKEIGRDISMHILGIDIQGEVTLVDKEWTRVEKRDSDIVFEYKDCSVEQHVIYIGKERCRMKNEIVRDEKSERTLNK